jgi:hypothetical protein
MEFQKRVVVTFDTFNWHHEPATQMHVKSKTVLGEYLKWVWARKD